MPVTLTSSSYFHLPHLNHFKLTGRNLSSHTVHDPHAAVAIWKPAIPFPHALRGRDSPSLRLVRAPQTFGRSCLPRAASRMGSRLLFQTADLFSI